MNFELLSTKDLMKELKRIDDEMKYEDNVKMLLIMRKEVESIKAELSARQVKPKRR